MEVTFQQGKAVFFGTFDDVVISELNIVATATAAAGIEGKGYCCCEESGENFFSEHNVRVR